MKNDKGYIHITKGFITKIYDLSKNDNNDSYQVIKLIQDFFEWGGDVLLTHNEANSFDNADVLSKTIIEEKWYDEGSCFSLVLSDDNSNIFVVWDITEYLKTITDIKQKDRIKEALNKFVNFGGVVKINGVAYVDADELNNYLKSN